MHTYFFTTFYCHWMGPCISSTTGKSVRWHKAAYAHQQLQIAYTNFNASTNTPNTRLAKTSINCTAAAAAVKRFKATGSRQSENETQITKSLVIIWSIQCHSLIRIREQLAIAGHITLHADVSKLLCPRVLDNNVTAGSYWAVVLPINSAYWVIYMLIQ